MSKPDSLSAILTLAADLIRDTAAAASQGRWSAADLADRGQGMRGWQVEHPASDGDGTFTVASVASLNPASDARWIALLSPAVAPHIEAWLRCAAEMCNEWDDPMTNAAIAFARSVLGVQEVVSDGS